MGAMRAAHTWCMVQGRRWHGLLARLGSLGVGPEEELVAMALSLARLNGAKVARSPAGWAWGRGGGMRLAFGDI